MMHTFGRVCVNSALEANEMSNAKKLSFLVAVLVVLAVVVSITMAARLPLRVVTPTPKVAAGTIPAVAATHPELRAFVEHVKLAGLTGILASPGPFTVFAPSNAAFSKIPGPRMARLMLPRNRGQLVSLLRYHVLNGVYTYAELRSLKQGTMLPTAQGKMVRITHRGPNVYVDGVRIVRSNIRARNGMIHEIGTVLTPPRY